MPDRTPTKVGREIFLAGLGLDLDSIEPWVIDRMVSMLDDQDFHAGEVLFSRGDPPEFLYFMHDGEVRLTREGRAPWTYRGRWLIGAYDAVSEQGRARDAVAVRDFHAMRVPAADWLDLLEDSPRLAHAAVLNVARGVAELEKRVPGGLPQSPAHHPGALRRLPAALSLLERVAAMVDVSMLRGGGVQALVDLAADSQEVSFDLGSIVFPRGVQHQQLIVLVEGEVLSTRVDPALERRYGPGDVLGGVAAFGAPALAWESRATTPGRGIAVDIEAWFELMEEHFDMVRSTLSAILARRELLLDHLAEASGGIVLT